MSDLKIGLAFGGGGARGLAHIQAIRAFEDLGRFARLLSLEPLSAAFARLYMPPDIRLKKFSGLPNTPPTTGCACSPIF